MLDYLVHDAIGDVDATALACEMQPYIIELGLRLRRKAKLAHVRGFCSALKRAMPRRFTSLASCCASFAVVTVRPSPRESDASARSTASRIYSRRRSRSSH